MYWPFCCPSTELALKRKMHRNAASPNLIGKVHLRTFCLRAEGTPEASMNRKAAQPPGNPQSFFLLRKENGLANALSTFDRVSRARDETAHKRIRHYLYLTE